MDVLERDGSQSRRASIKRPWEEDTTLPETGNAWNSAIRPPVDAFRRDSSQRGGDAEANGSNQYSPATRNSTFKRPKFEGLDYNSFPPQNLEPNGKISLPRDPNLIYTQNRGSPKPSTSKERFILPPKSYPSSGSIGPHNHDGPADSHDTPNLCPRCRRLTIQSQEFKTVDYADGCEDCQRNPELAWVTQECSVWLTHLADTLRSGLSSEQRSIIRGHDQHRLGSTGGPPIAEVGLKQTLNWVLGRIHIVNQLADQLVGQVPADSLQGQNENIYRNGTKVQDGPADNMKRRIGVDSDDPFKLRDDADSPSDSKSHTRRRSVTTLMLAKEDLLPPGSQHDYHPSLPNTDGLFQRFSGMNPPPAPSHRQLPSPPGRSFPSPSPTSLSFPSPSIPAYGTNSQSVNLTPSSIHQPATNNYLPPINAAHSSDTALRDHTAALQHEVSVQKIALSSLQGEHDKLLAAFSRSQTRASALERKHAVSDTEIISLTEEKLRLQAQVVELERDVEELSRSRDESRQAAVQEGAQYVEIVKKASRLEELAGEERRKWNRLKEDMEQKIDALNAGQKGEDGAVDFAEDAAPNFRLRNEIETDTPESSAVLMPHLKMELMSEPRRDTLTSYASAITAPQESVGDLKAEIGRLRERCAGVESALSTIRDESRSMEDIVRTILERAASALES